MRRREFITLLGGAAIWPLAARAQQAAMPVIGLLDPRSPDALADRLRGFRRGLNERGFVEGENVAIESRWADNRIDRLPELAANLVRRQVAVIVTPGGLASALAAKAATTTIPIVFVVADDPVKLGLVASLARPDGNLTGINFFTGELTAKRLELPRELMPAATRVAVLVNPANPANADTASREAGTAARAIGVQIQIFNATTSREISAAFATFGNERPDAVLVGLDPFFNSRRVQLVQLATRYGLPTSYPARDFVEAGGLGRGSLALPALSNSRNRSSRSRRGNCTPIHVARRSTSAPSASTSSRRHTPLPRRRTALRNGGAGRTRDARRPVD